MSKMSSEKGGAVFCRCGMRSSSSELARLLRYVLVLEKPKDSLFSPTIGVNVPRVGLCK